MTMRAGLKARNSELEIGEALLSPPGGGVVERPLLMNDWESGVLYFRCILNDVNIFVVTTS